MPGIVVLPGITEPNRNSPMYFQFMDNRSIRTSKWSLIKVEVDGSGWELYNNMQDPLETNNLANKNPQLVSQLANDWLKWWKKVNINNSTVMSRRAPPIVRITNHKGIEVLEKNISQPQCQIG